jgi:CP family cyanate transporter-like MFS transporter
MSLILLISLVVGVGLGVAGALLPVVVREHFMDRPAFATGIYTAGLQVGASTSSAIAVPIAFAFGSWRGALIAFSVLIALFGIAWWLLVPSERGRTVRVPRPPALPWRRGIVWTIALLFALRSCVFQAMNAWLAAIYVEHGWSATEAGALVAVEVGIGFPTTLLISHLADRSGSRRAYLVAGSIGMIVGTGGILVLPDLGWIWAPILGIGMGVHFPITLTLPLDISDSRAEVAGATALVLGAGYLVAGSSPLLLGALRDAAGNFTPVVVVTVLLAVGALVVSLLMGDIRPREAQAVHAPASG